MKKHSYPTKKCTGCLIVKDLSGFYKATGKRTVRAICKDCHNKESSERLRNKPSTKQQRRENSKRFRTANPGYSAEQSRKFRNENPTYNYRKVKDWRHKNPGSRKTERALRRASEVQAIPKWMTAEHKKQIKEFYKNCPAGYEVDHRTPLNGENVKGLHVIWNLQYLTPKENRQKGNKII